MSDFDEENPGELHERTISTGPLLGGLEWRWVCSCGATGSWNIQGEGAARAGLKRHLERTHGGRWS